MSQTKPLALAWCSHVAALYAVKHWHYARTLPLGKMTRIGVWEDGHFIGAVVFSLGANRHMSKFFGLPNTQCAELARVALATHRTPVSRIVAIAVRMLKKFSPGLRLVVSYADPRHGHIGGIYQAGNWIYTGESLSAQNIKIGSRYLHKRAYTGHCFGMPRLAMPVGAVMVTVPAKYRYAMPLDDAMRASLTSYQKPYPKRGRSRENAAAPPSAEGGVNPTRPLQTLETNS